ncbi:PH domain-containing protein [Streptomyces antimicrobicus]|uniref:PH domain-containing protein n=1 Tax=Streptomyces antimicrobicus TaxID=2883108 RepID=A0ABS8B1M6_9ACTN|nr:PH domain-containing protein [Streptomyces antimicrobicus]MCB5178514.1 PH domain-containing protein [Streptomyces antimicrobicus]
MSSVQPPEDPAYDDRIYRSPMALVSGVLLLALIVWLCGDAVVRGHGNAPWYGVASALLAVPLVVAYTLRPAVFANEDRLRVRNPFRTVDLPWATVDAVRAGYSSEVLADGEKYQLWSIPVSLRARKRANRKGDGEKAGADRSVSELQELAERCARRQGAQGTVTVRWSYEIIAPAVAGAILLVVLLATR